MIKVTRLPKPAILAEKEIEWTEELCQALEEYCIRIFAYESGTVMTKPQKPEALRSRYAHEQIKSRLESMFGTKCAYCESSVTNVSYQHVEHFRPKSIYPRLAYKWDNLLLACERCNSGCKGTQFPLVDGSNPVEDRTSPCSLDDSDDNMLVNPCEDNPDDFFRYADEWVVCRNARAKVTRDVYGLNREDLKDYRREWLILVETAAKAYLYFAKCGDSDRQSEVADVLRRSVSSSAQYSAMTRSKLESLGIDVEALLF